MNFETIYIQKPFKYNDLEKKTKINYINFFENPYSAIKKDILNPGFEKSYFISPINQNPKFTDYLKNCTAFFGINPNKNNFLVHTGSNTITKDSPKTFEEHFKIRLEEFWNKIKKSEREKIILGLVGGNYFKKTNQQSGLSYRELYLDAINLINKYIKDITKKEIVIYSTPNDYDKKDISQSVLISNKKIILYRPPIQLFNDFKPTKYTDYLKYLKRKTS